MAIGMFVLTAFVATTAAQVAQAPSRTVDYDTFMQMDTQGRLRTFNEVTPENRAELVQTTIKRWVEKNKARLSPEQLKCMEENLAFVTADRYRQPPTPEQQNQMKALEARTAALFSPEDMRDALTIHATYIPKKG